MIKKKAKVAPRCSLDFRVNDDFITLSRASFAFKQQNKRFMKRLLFTADQKSKHRYELIQEATRPLSKATIVSNPQLDKLLKKVKSLQNKLATAHQQYTRAQKIKPVRFDEQAVRDLSSSFAVLENSKKIFSLPGWDRMAGVGRLQQGKKNSPDRYANFYEDMHKEEFGGRSCEAEQARQAFQLINFRQVASIMVREDKEKDGDKDRERERTRDKESREKESRESGYRLPAAMVDRWVRKYG